MLAAARQKSEQRKLPTSSPRRRASDVQYKVVEE